jgi:DNA-binding NtrC family response regulator
MRKPIAIDGGLTAFVTGRSGGLTVLYVGRPGNETPGGSVLHGSSHDEDYVSLESIFKPDWTVVANTTVTSALAVLKEMPFPVVLCDTDLTSGTWREMLEHISLLPDPPLLIVTSRLADDYLWAEALNLGAWDVLAKPFDAEEVMRTVSCAWQHWQDRHGIHTGRTAQKKAATGARHMSATGT